MNSSHANPSEFLVCSAQWPYIMDSENKFALINSLVTIAFHCRDHSRLPERHGVWPSVIEAMINLLCSAVFKSWLLYSRDAIQDDSKACHNALTTALNYMLSATVFSRLMCQQYDVNHPAEKNPPYVVNPFFSGVARGFCARKGTACMFAKSDRNRRNFNISVINGTLSHLSTALGGF